LTRLRKVAGASVQAAGAVVPVLDAAELVEAALKLGVTPSDTGVYDGKPVEARKRNVLVVEDSITSRTLLKNVLEAAGYHVRTAVDGIDALTVLGTEDVDLVVSDVEMPRMDGFDHTGRLRSDDRFAELPVVLVTALQSREDRERGIDVGANAYIVKSSFDQGDLLSVIERLI
jgi:two-component system chemotaxis sensor kinase CheA